MSDADDPTRETMVVASDGSMRPIRELFEERHRMRARYGRAQLERAYRVRAGIEATLLNCLCMWPLVEEPTTSGHPEWCPSHHIVARAAVSQEGTPRTAAVHFVEPTPPCRECKCEGYHLGDCTKASAEERMRFERGVAVHRAMGLAPPDTVRPLPASDAPPATPPQGDLFAAASSSPSVVTVDEEVPPT